MAALTPHPPTAVSVLTRLTPEVLRDFVAALPSLMAGRSPDGSGVVRRLQLLLGLQFLSLVREDYLIKSRGGTGAGGIKWKPLALSTVAARRGGPGRKRVGMAAAKLGESVEILRDTSRGFASLSPEGPGENADTVWRFGRGSLEVGSRVPYMRYLHNGTSNIPARPLWPDRLPDSWKKLLAKRIGEGLIRVLTERVNKGS